ncbi:hypothetical protein AURDEDRAFT_115120 [Auricularia subglabra TFB-10046 SS5]|nr:hypothetical protein AURDEDRAFT_115120 [Auricularia subglabra TFB-10046 SS5]
MADKLADETLHQVLALVFDVPDDEFADVSGASSSPFACRQHSTSDALLVCKRWMRVGTPLLYDTVVLRSVAQSQSLAKALSKNPGFVPYLKKLRIEGGFGASVGRILNAAIALSDLHLSLDLNSKDSVASMCDALPAVNPTRLILTGQRRPSTNVIKTMKSIQTASLSWSKLTTLVMATRVFVWPLAEMIIQIRNISTAHVRGDLYDFELHHVDGMLSTWPQRTVHLDTADVPHHMERVLFLLQKYPGRLVVSCNGIPVSTTPREDVIAGPPMRQVSSQVQRKIWTLVFGHILGETCERAYNFRTRGSEKVLVMNETALRYMLVSRLFLDVCVELAATRVQISSWAQLDAFALLLQDRPHLQSRVQSLYLFVLPRTGTLAFLPSLTGLRYLNCHCISSHVDALIPTLENLVELDITFEMTAEDFPTSLSFPMLRMLAFTVPCDSSEAPPRLEYHLPRLEELTVSAQCPLWVVDEFSQIELPQLRVLNIFHTDTPALGNFLRAHGAACVTVATLTQNFELVLLSCPNMHTVVLLSGLPLPPIQALDHGHPALKTLQLSSINPDVPNKRSRKQLSDMGTNFFDRLSKDAFPVLKDVVAPRLMWPTIPRNIPGNQVVKWAELLHAKGFKLVDSSGQGWRPRLKTARGG